MAIRIKRRSAGLAGPPDALIAGELAYNEVDGILYYGHGVGADGRTATTVIAIGGADLVARVVAIEGHPGIGGGGGGGGGPQLTFFDSTVATFWDGTPITFSA